MKILVTGAEFTSDLPGLDRLQGKVDIRFAPNEERLKEELPGTEVLLGWNFRGNDLPNQWRYADKLRWIHWCGAGVDAVMFPELVESDVILTNSRSLFDRAMAEYILGYMLIESKYFRDTWKAQRERKWGYRLSKKLAGQHAMIFGVGSIGMQVGTLLKAVGVEVVGVGRSARDNDAVFGTILTRSDVLNKLSGTDWVIGVLPSIPDTQDYFDTEFFGAMQSSSHFVNVGRGSAVNDSALIAALREGKIAGALIDVFREEPLTADSVFWDVPNLVVSPHMSGDYLEYQTDIVKLFMENLKRYRNGVELKNVVNKDLGFISKVS